MQRNVNVRLDEADIAKLDRFAAAVTRKVAALNKAVGITAPPPLTRSDVVRSCVDAYLSDPHIQAVLAAEDAETGRREAEEKTA